MFDQLRALIWLQFVIAIRSKSSTKSVSYALLTVFFALTIILGLAVGAGLFFAGWKLGAGSPRVVLLLADGCVLMYLFLYFAIVVGELQRSDAIDLRKMLFLPVPLKMVFALNFVVSLISGRIVLFALPALGLALGLWVGRGHWMLLSLPLAGAFFLMISAWTYYAQGTLSALMENKRRRQLIMGGLMAVLILVPQLPQLVLPVSQRFFPDAHFIRAFDDGLLYRMLDAANVILPVGWLPYGAYALADHRLLAAAGCLTGMGALAGIGLALGYRQTHKYFLGVGRRAEPTRKKPSNSTVRTNAKALIHARLPFIDDDVSAMATASMLSLLRQPMMYMQLIFPLIMAIILFANPVMSRSELASPFLPIGVGIFSYFGAAQYMMNVFGADKGGFRALLLLPTERWKYLAAKNIAFLPLSLGISLLYFLLACLIHPPTSVSFTMGLMVMGQVYLMFSTFGNFMSLYFPFRLETSGKARRSRVSRNLQAALFSMLASVISLLPSAFCMAFDPVLRLLLGYEGIALGPSISVLTFILLAALYYLCLKSAGRVFQKREYAILDELIRDTE